MVCLGLWSSKIIIRCKHVVLHPCVLIFTLIGIYESKSWGPNLREEIPFKWVQSTPPGYGVRSFDSNMRTYYK